MGPCLEADKKYVALPRLQVRRLFFPGSIWLLQTWACHVNSASPPGPSSDCIRKDAVSSLLLAFSSLSSFVLSKQEI